MTEAVRSARAAFFVRGQPEAVARLRRAKDHKEHRQKRRCRPRMRGPPRAWPRRPRAGQRAAGPRRVGNARRASDCDQWCLHLCRPPFPTPPEVGAAGATGHAFAGPAGISRTGDRAGQTGAGARDWRCGIFSRSPLARPEKGR